MKVGDEFECPKALDTEKNRHKMSEMNKKQSILRFNFDCQVCGRRFFDYQLSMEHMKGAHGDIMKKYNSIKEYKQAVKDGREFNQMKNWREYDE